MPNLLLLSNDDNFIESVKEHLSYHAPEYDVDSIYSPDKVVDLTVLDDRVDVLRYIRKYNFRVPLIFLSSGEAPMDLLRDVDIVLKKPFSLDEFLENVRTCITKYDNSGWGCFYFENHQLWPVKREILDLVTNKTTKLTDKEVEVLKYLYKAKGRIVPKVELLKEVWGYKPDATTHTVETHIYRLRQKINDTDYPLIIYKDNGYFIKWMWEESHTLQDEDYA